MPDITKELPGAVIRSNKEAINATGRMPRPQIHMLAEDMAQPYVGHVVCRRFYQGEDTVAAIGDLGVLPSVMRMTRLLVVWEHLDLRTALLEENDSTGMNLMMLDAQLDEHTVHQHPFEGVPTGEIVDGVPAIRVQWNPPTERKDGPLPRPITRLLDTWREWRSADLQKTAVALQDSGYELYWTNL